MPRQGLIALVLVGCLLSLVAVDLVRRRVRSSEQVPCEVGDDCGDQGLRQLRVPESTSAGLALDQTAEDAGLPDIISLAGAHGHGQAQGGAHEFSEAHGSHDSHDDVPDLCDRETGGTCTFLACDASRGKTVCDSSKKCVCAENHCVFRGICYPNSMLHDCESDTGGSCNIAFCDPSRGDTDCDGGKCYCSVGHCAAGGRCYPVTDTGGTCKHGGCDASRGPTTCQVGRCLCKENHIAFEGKCIPAPGSVLR